MKLFFAPVSPFARKCRAVVIHKGLEGRVELHEVAPMEDPPQLLAVTPLATVPALVLDNGKALCDSPLICEYLDLLPSGKPALFPAVGATDRFEMLSLAALADGVMDAAVARVIEGRKPEEKQYSPWMNRKENAVLRTLAAIEKQLPDAAAPLTIASLGVLVALEYVSFRLPHLAWRETHAALAAWGNAVGRHPALAATAPK